MHEVYAKRCLLLLLICFFTLISTAQSQTQAWKVGERVEASFEGSSYSFYPAVIVGIKAGYYRVHYDDHDSNWDDWVPVGKVRPLAIKAGGSTATAQATPANRGAQGACVVGSRLSRAGMTNRPAAITEIDPRKGLYRVKYDNGDLPEWLPPRLFDGCVGSVGVPVNDDYFIGKWSLFVGPTAHYEDRSNGNSYLVVGPGGLAPPIVVNADGTYIWTLDSRTVIRGRWRKMAATEIKYLTIAPAILLINGEGGQDWQMWAQPPVGEDDTRDRVTIEGMKIGLSTRGTRIQ